MTAMYDREADDDLEIAKGYLYEKMRYRWSITPPTLQGVMGGREDLHEPDIDFSEQFLKVFTEDPQRHMGKERALDAGCGIGRVTKDLLLKHFKSVVVVDQDRRFLDAVLPYVGEDANRVEKVLNNTIQKYVPQPEHYDAVWLQWILGYLIDDDIATILRRMRRSLRQNGFIFVKEWLGRDALDTLHEDGEAVVRTHSKLVSFFEEADLKVIKWEEQVFNGNIRNAGIFALM